MKKKLIAVLLLLVLLLSACTVPLKETGTEEDKTKAASITEAGTRESVSGAAVTEPETAATEPEPVAEEPEQIAVIRSIQTIERTASTSDSSGGQTETVTAETYFSAEGLPARVVSVRTVHFSSQAPEDSVVADENEIFFYYRFDENGRLDRIRAKTLPGEIGLEWEEENESTVRFFFLYEGEKKTELSSSMITAAGNILQLLQHYTAFADAALVFEGTNSRIQLKNGRVVSQRIQQMETMWTETEEEESDSDGITRSKTLTHSGSTDMVQIMEYDREKHMIGLRMEQNGRNAAMRIRYESVTEDGKRTDRGYIDELETDDEEIKAEMAAYEGIVLVSYQFDEQGRLLSYTMYEDDQPLQRIYYDEEGRAIRQESFFSGSYENLYVTETEYRKASEIEETIKLAED